MAVSFQKTAHFPPDANCFVCQRRNLRDPRGKPPIVAHGPIHGNTWADVFRKYVPCLRPQAEPLMHHMHEPCLKELMQTEGAAGRNCPGCRSLIDRTSVLSWKERAVEWKEKKRIESLGVALLVATTTNIFPLSVGAILSRAASILPGGQIVQAIGAVAGDKLLTTVLNYFHYKNNDESWIQTALYQMDWTWSLASFQTQSLVETYHSTDPNLLPPISRRIRLVAAAAGVAAVALSGMYGLTAIEIANVLVTERYVWNKRQNGLAQQRQEQQNLQAAQEVAGVEPEPSAFP